MFRTIVASGVLVAAAGGCSRGIDAAAPAEVAFAADGSGRGSYREAPAATPNPPFLGGLVVPPDRATASATVEVRAPDPASATARAHEVATYVSGLWLDDPLCAASVLDYSPVHAKGSESGASFSVSVSAQLAGLESTLARMERVEDCLSRFRSIATDSGLLGVQVNVGSMVATVDDPGRFRPQLLQQHLEPLREVSKLEDLPEQFDPAGVRCTSAGDVTIQGRTLGGVTLAVDFGCTRS